MDVYTKVQRGDESILIKLDRCLEDSSANWSIIIKLAAGITAISIFTMVLKYV